MQMVGVTHGTNSETRRYAFQLRLMLGIETIRRIQFVLSDGDPKIYIPFDSVRERLYPSAIHGLCSFHRVAQPLQRLQLQRRDKPQSK
jgi:hypothetical protein